MTLLDNMTGIQHIGIPVNDIEKTIEFYKSLGFEIAHRTENKAAGEKVVFLQMKNLVVEAYETKKAVRKDGAVNHFAIDVKNIDTVYDMISAEGYEMACDRIEFLPFWAKGVRFFTIFGPDRERIEFCEKL